MLMRLRQSSILVLLVQADGLPSLGKATSEEENVTSFELDLAVLGNLQHFFECDRVATHPAEFDAWQVLSTISKGNTIEDQFSPFFSAYET